MRSEKTAEGLFGATKVFPKMRNSLQQILQEMKGAHEQCTLDVACFTIHEEQHVAKEIKEIKRGIGPIAQKAHEGCETASANRAGRYPLLCWPAC